MKNFDLNIPLLSEKTVKTFYFLENEAKEITGKTTLKEIDKFLECELKEAEKIYGAPYYDEETEEFYPDEYYNSLFIIESDLTNIRVRLLIEFLKIFPHRRKHMSLKYISKQLGISIDTLTVWFHFESVEIIKKKHGMYVDFNEFMEFMKKISRKDYKLIHTKKDIIQSKIVIRFKY